MKIPTQNQERRPRSHAAWPALVTIHVLKRILITLGLMGFRTDSLFNAWARKALGIDRDRQRRASQAHNGIFRPPFRNS